MYCCWLAFETVFVYLFIVETKNRTLEETAALFDGDELDKLHAAVHASGRTIVPLSLYFSGSVVKVEIAVATGKKHYDKRHALRERQDRRETERAVFGRHRGE